MERDHISPVEVSVAVITVSTTRTKENDSSGRAISTIMTEAAIPVRHYTIVGDDIGQIRTEVHRAMERSNCIIINGGTGLTPDDCTIEAVLPLLDKKIDGFGEFFRMKSYQEIGISAMLSRAVAGLCQKKVIFCIPGSTPAVILATRDLIIPSVRHILSHAER